MDGPLGVIEQLRGQNFAIFFSTKTVPTGSYKHIVDQKFP